MHFSRRVLAAVPLVMTVIYLGYPYATLYRLGVAMRQADAATLQTMVDWPAVREGLKEDLCDMVLDEAPGTTPSTELPAFVSGFVRAMTIDIVDRTVTPEAIVSINHVPDGSARAEAHVEWAFFDNPTQFTVNVRPGGIPQIIRMTLELRGARWQVRRVWLPDSLLGMTGPGT